MVEVIVELIIEVMIFGLIMELIFKMIFELIRSIFTFLNSLADLAHRLRVSLAAFWRILSISPANR